MPKKNEAALADAATWVDRFADELYSYARWKVSNEETARDLVQDTFFAAYRRIDDFRGDSSERTWLFAILKNKILDHYRSKYKNKEHLSITDGGDAFTGSGGWKKEELPGNWKSTEVDALQQKEFFEVLSNCRDKLTNQQQLVFAYKYLEEKDADDICKELDITSSNYWVLLHRARVQMRSCLEKNWINK